MDLVNRLKHYMDTTQLTISQFADRCGIPRPTMSQLINGRNKRISDEVINKIHNAFPGLSILWLMFGEGEMDANANIRISEPQNGQNPGIIAAQRPDNQSTTDNNIENETITIEESSSDVFENLLFETPQPPHFATPAPQDDTSLKENIMFDTASIKEDTTPSPSIPSQEPANTPNPLGRGRDVTNTINAQRMASQALGNAPQPILAEEGKRISISPDAHKKITNIVVFYSDNSFQSFLPDA